tara:strand:- start:726 stop:1343 length:618 start_codon:yes stop_codon:yes gene_type:complete
MSREVVVCCPHKYYSESFQTFIRNNCNKEDRRWIYDLINGHIDMQETVFCNEPEWMLCLDRHPGADTRYLIVFKKLHLKTIRDLRQGDLALLHRIQDEVRRTLRRLHPSWTQTDIYFHYHPSVYQLHAHVCQVTDENSDRVWYNSRRHQFKHVVRNLNRDTNWYRDALILTGKNKGMRHVLTFEDDRWPNAENHANWKPKPMHTI